VWRLLRKAGVQWPDEEAAAAGARQQPTLSAVFSLLWRFSGSNSNNVPVVSQHVQSSVEKVFH
jgi:hypothetical protein